MVWAQFLQKLQKKSFHSSDYTNPKYHENVDRNCSYDRPADNDKFCPFEMELLGNCSPENTDKKYGYPQKKPCVFLKLNKVSVEAQQQRLQSLVLIQIFI